MAINSISNLFGSYASTTQSTLTKASDIDFLKMRNTLQSSQTSGILQALPKSPDFVLSQSLMNAISDSKIMTTQILETYESRMNAALPDTQKS